MSTKKLENLYQKKSKLDARIKKIKARERERNRKRETRRKIIAGALALHHMRKNPESQFSKVLVRLLNEYVTKSHERKLLGLEPLPEASNSVPANDLQPSKGTLTNDFIESGFDRLL